MRRGIGITAGSLAAVAIAGGGVWADVALSSGRAAPAAVKTAAPTAPKPPAVAAASTSHATPPSSPIALASMASSAAAVGVCRQQDLQFSNPPSLEGGMGGLTVAIVFRNTGTQPCSLIGWPTIATLSLRTKVQYTTFTGAGFVVPVTRIVLQPGGAGSAALDLYGRNSSYGEQCAEVGSWAVTIPGSRQPTLVPWPKHQGACPGGSVLVSPVYAGDQVEIGFGSADPSSIPLLGPFDSPPTMP
jgi:Protein of unknown function (DUF4232)